MKTCCEKWLTEQFGDDRETIDAVYAEYAEAMAKLVADLAAARASGDAERVDGVLHTIKGTAAMAGDADISSLAAAARSLGTAEELDAAERRIGELAAEI